MSFDDFILVETQPNVVFYEDGDIYCNVMSGKYNVPFQYARISSGNLYVVVGTTKFTAGSSVRIQCTNNLLRNSEQFSTILFRFSTSKNLIHTNQT